VEYFESDNWRPVGMGGLTGIQWENRIAEISLIIHQHWRNRGIGQIAAALLLDEGFGNLGLKTIFGECYLCNCNTVQFWKFFARVYFGYTTTLPNRKYYKGKFWDSLYFSIDNSGQRN